MEQSLESGIWLAPHSFCSPTECWIDYSRVTSGSKIWYKTWIKYPKKYWKKLINSMTNIMAEGNNFGAAQALLISSCFLPLGEGKFDDSRPHQKTVWSQSRFYVIWQRFRADFECEYLTFRAHWEIWSDFHVFRELQEFVVLNLEVCNVFLFIIKGFILFYF